MYLRVKSSSGIKSKDRVKIGFINKRSCFLYERSRFIQVEIKKRRRFTIIKDYVLTSNKKNKAKNGDDTH